MPVYRLMIMILLAIGQWPFLAYSQPKSCSKIVSVKRPAPKTILPEWMRQLNLESAREIMEDELALDGEVYTPHRWRKYAQHIESGDTPFERHGKVFRATLKRHQFAFYHSAGADVYHGTSSIVLDALARNPRDPLRGLLPSGVLDAMGLAAFSGSFDQGTFEDGIGQYGISVTSRPAIDYAIEYTLGDLTWSPQEAEKLLAQIAQEGIDLSESSGLDGAGGKKLYFSDDMLRELAKGDRRRLKVWQDMTNRQKDLITNAFPVLLAIRLSNRNYIIDFWNQNLMGQEQAVLGKVEKNAIVAIFVPQNKIALTRSLVGNEIPLFPIEPVHQAHIPFGEVRDQRYQ